MKHFSHNFCGVSSCSCYSSPHFTRRALLAVSFAHICKQLALRVRCVRESVIQVTFRFSSLFLFGLAARRYKFASVSGLSRAFLYIRKRAANVLKARRCNAHKLPQTAKRMTSTIVFETRFFDVHSSWSVRKIVEATSSVLSVR